MESQDFAIRAGRREDAEAAARLWMQSAEEHTSHDPVYATVPGAEKTMRRFLADLARNGYTFVFVATVGDRMVGFVSGELREGSPTFLPKTWASVDDVFVHPDYRNGGIGRALCSPGHDDGAAACTEEEKATRRPWVVQEALDGAES